MAPPSGRHSGREAPVADVRHALGLAAARDVEHEDLRFLLAVALRRECDAPRVRAPGDSPDSGLAENVICRGGALPSAGTSHRSLALSLSS